MTMSVYQALTCYMAARSLTELTANPEVPIKVLAFDVHAVANGMDDCISYATYKYIQDNVKQRIEEHFQQPEGSGIYGMWRFKDESRLYAICGDIFCIETPEQTFLDVRSWPKLETFTHTQQEQETTDALHD
jgi:hypothetical protein